jgi:hypothetical protein
MATPFLVLVVSLFRVDLVTRLIQQMTLGGREGNFCIVMARTPPPHEDSLDIDDAICWIVQHTAPVWRQPRCRGTHHIFATNAGRRLTSGRELARQQVTTAQHES